MPKSHVVGRGVSGRYRGLAALVVCGLVAGAVGLAAWCQAGLSMAQGLAKHGLWSDVHAPLERYLRLHPRDPSANMLRAEALVKDDGLPLLQRITESIERLEQIPDDAPEAAAARIAAARVHLFLRYEPVAAWRSLERAMKLDPESLEAHLLAWRLFELIGRIDDVEELFWKAYELSPEAERPLRLREWYASQFFPQTTLAEFDTLMGFRQAISDPVDIVEGRRLQRFVRAEPTEPWGHAALARWFLSRGEPEVAVEVLDRAATVVPPEGRGDPYWLSTEIDVLCDVGEAEKAAEAFARWPASDRSRRYALARGRVLADADGDAAGAVTAYDEALAIWPGPVDWQTVNRSATCLARAGDEQGANARREEARRIERLMKEEVHQRLFKRLADLSDPALLAEMEAFYRDLNRPREAAGWAAARAALASPVSAAPGRVAWEINARFGGCPLPDGRESMTIRQVVGGDERVHADAAPRKACDGDVAMTRGLVAVAMVAAVMAASGCTKAPPPEKPSTVDTGISPRERAMQNMPDNMQPKYQQQQNK